jgi:hypothetical protein
MPLPSHCRSAPHNARPRLAWQAPSNRNGRARLRYTDRLQLLLASGPLAAAESGGL